MTETERPLRPAAETLTATEAATLAEGLAALVEREAHHTQPALTILAREVVGHATVALSDHAPLTPPWDALCAQCSTPGDGIEWPCEDAVRWIATLRAVEHAYADAP